MNDPENNFEALRKLMSLKRHEVPPPGFFNNFSDTVVARIRKGDIENPDVLGSRIHSEAPWLLRLMRSLQAKPAYAGAFASAVGLLLVAGIVYTDNPGTSPEDLMPPQSAENSASLAAASITAPAMVDPAVGTAPVVSMSSTNPVLNFEASSPTFGGTPIFQAPTYPQYPQ